MATPPGSFEGLGGNPNLVPSTSGTTTIDMGGISPWTGPLMVLGATQGLGPWQGISDFLGSTFNSSSKLRRHAEASAPKSWFSQSINTFLNEAGLNSYKTSGKGSTLQGSDAFKRAGNLSKIIRAVKEKYPGYTQWQYAEMFKRSNLDRFMPSISVSDAKESRKQELLNPETAPGWTTPEQMKKKHGKGLMNAQWANQQLLGKAALHKKYYSQENFNYRPKELRTGKGSNPETRWRGRRTDMTMDLFFKNLNKAIDNNTFLPAAGATQEQPPAQEQPTREQSLAKNAFKGIGIGSAIVRNVFNPKRLPRPDLGFGQKLFSRQY
jgi:hypothetical protein